MDHSDHSPVYRMIVVLAAVLGIALPGAAQFATAWVVPAAAHTPGVGSTYWMTDLSIHNPQFDPLPVRIFFLPSGQDNSTTPEMDVQIGAWETYNLWDVLGEYGFDHEGTGAFLIAVDTSRIQCDDEDDCSFFVASRTYTPDPDTVTGEYGQGIPGFTAAQGLDVASYAFALGILNDGDTFRTNVGAASWTPAWTTIGYDVQDAQGNVVDSVEFDVPPFGHVQHRLAEPVMGGTVVFYLVDGPDNALVFPYASVVNQETGDPTFMEARAVPVWFGKSAEGAGHPPEGATARPLPAPSRTVRPPADAPAVHRSAPGAPVD